MELIKTAAAGTMESGDIMVTIDPRESGGITLDLSSNVMQQFGRQIEAVIRETLGELSRKYLFKIYYYPIFCIRTN